MAIKELKINFEGKQIAKKELELSLTLTKVREILLDLIITPFVFLNEDEKEIPKSEENDKILEDVLDGKNLNLAKEKIVRKVLGPEIDSIGSLKVHLFPQKDLTIQDKESSSNIMVIGETGTGKSTWINALINYLQGIQFEEKLRYNLFDEKKLQADYQSVHGKKPKGASVTDVPGVYNIEPTILFNNPIRIIDTAGYGDTRNTDTFNYDEKITQDINTLFESSTIENLNAVCLIFKATETRVHERTKYVITKLLELFGKDVKNNIVIIFTFANSFKDIPAMTTLADTTSPFYQHLGDLKNYKSFVFNSKVYFMDNDISDNSEKNKMEYDFENNAKSFGSLLKHIFSLNRISLESTKKVIRDRLHIKNNIKNLCSNLGDIMLQIDSTLFNMDELSKYQAELQSLKSAKFPLKKVIDYIEESEIIEKEVKCETDWYVLYCDTCKKVCHGKCKGPKEGFYSSTYGCDMIGTFSSSCSECKCGYTSHKFLQSYKVKEEKKNRKEIEKWVEDPNLKESKEKNIKAIAEMEKKKEITQNKLNQLNSQIQYSLMNGINCLFQLALKDDELNDKALKKDKKYGFTTQILNENLNKGKKKGTIYDEFIGNLPNIENICKSDQTKENAVEEIKEKLLNQKK